MAEELYPFFFILWVFFEAAYFLWFLSLYHQLRNRGENSGLVGGSSTKDKQAARVQRLFNDNAPITRSVTAAFKEKHVSHLIYSSSDTIRWLTHLLLLACDSKKRWSREPREQDTHHPKKTRRLPTAPCGQQGAAHGSRAKLKKK